MPNSLEAEQSVVGSMIMSKDAIVTASEMLLKEDFYHQQYGIIFETMVELFTEGQFKTMTLGYFIFDKVQAGQYYYPSAIGLIFTFIGVPLTLLVKRVCDKTFEDVAY